MYRELSVAFSFTDEERVRITEALTAIRVSPYKAYPAFRNIIRRLISEDIGLQRFHNAISWFGAQSSYDQPFFFAENCPIDADLPEFSNEDPVVEKYAKKKTFVAEGFLQIFADLSGQHPISYMNVNDGDVFQDIFPKESLKHTQSQKALGPINFHKDLANHFVRPDYVNILGLRSHEANEICTTFVSNRDVLENVSATTRDVLRQTEFYTPFDDLTTSENRVDVGRAPNHPILSGDADIRFFENRTEGLTARAKAAVAELLEVAHAHKAKVLMRPGDFVSIANNLSLHGKEIHRVASEEQKAKRWSIKTVNVQSIAPHVRRLVEGTDYLVNG
ncbi:TauD/TfdA family dioxygenase [Cupriavidus alkaliphilus]|uniref:TauD/TfdA-like domain-containing protein n=1 Tax=Cupriavidus alkaliphilus TaxID=942866 RepID=A0A7W4YN91_9BURK|nr:TauD/TfdA family dioxygenase [Cupriavidus alkaliphilus]MBB3005460.1 hypothetical protein [Cupriavidus alkaliphilus]